MVDYSDLMLSHFIAVYELEQEEDRLLQYQYTHNEGGKTYAPPKGRTFLIS